MITQKKTANAIGGKTARACESCLKRRAKWFCAADDAFLCHACDSSVHSANDLASRHHRVCLETSSKRPPPQQQQQQLPSWHHGFAKKARTPRKNMNNKRISNKDTCKYNTQMMSVVPEVGNDDEYEDEGLLFLVEEAKNYNKSCVNDDDQMIFSVPNLDDDTINKGFKEEGVIIGLDDNYNDDELLNFSLMDFEGDNNAYDHDVHGWEFPENELAEFAADVESLLEQEEEEEGIVSNKGMKHEQEGEVIISANDCDHTYFDWSIDVESEMFNFDLNDNYNGGEVDEHDNSHHYHHHQAISGEEEGNNNGKVVVPIIKDEVEESNNNIVDDDSMEASSKKRKIVLRLNYDEVINAWASQGCSSPWTTGRRPEFDFDHHGWPYCMGDLRPPGIDRRGNVKGGDGGREARVSRYREKRRTRLFSKKIRYEVRKLNAEKRPRLKGRFVKRTSLSQGVGDESTFLNQIINT